MPTDSASLAPPAGRIVLDDLSLRYENPLAQARAAFYAYFREPRVIPHDIVSVWIPATCFSGSYAALCPGYTFSIIRFKPRGRLDTEAMIRRLAETLAAEKSAALTEAEGRRLREKSTSVAFMPTAQVEAIYGAAHRLVRASHDVLRSRRGDRASPQADMFDGCVMVMRKTIDSVSFPDEKVALALPEKLAQPCPLCESGPRGKAICDARRGQSPDNIAGLVMLDDAGKLRCLCCLRPVPSTRVFLAEVKSSEEALGRFRLSALLCVTGAEMMCCGVESAVAPLFETDHREGE